MSNISKVRNIVGNKTFAVSNASISLVAHEQAFAVLGNTADGMVLRRENMDGDLAPIEHAFPVGTSITDIKYIAALGRVGAVGYDLTDKRPKLFLFNPENMSLTNTVNLTPGNLYAPYTGPTLSVYGGTIVVNWNVVVYSDYTDDADLLSSGIYSVGVYAVVPTSNLSVTIALLDSQSVNDLLGAVPVTGGGFKLLFSTYVGNVEPTVTYGYKTATLATASQQFLPPLTVTYSDTVSEPDTLGRQILCGFTGLVFYIYETHTQKTVSINLITGAIKFQVVTTTALDLPSFRRGILTNGALFVATERAVFKIPVPFVGATSTPTTTFYEAPAGFALYDIVPVGNRLKIIRHSV